MSTSTTTGDMVAEAHLERAVEEDELVEQQRLLEPDLLEPLLPRQGRS